jgi:FkbM family methyltransferase
VGAHDGIQLNNTLFFEKTHAWSGVNVEPLPRVYEELVKNRPACTNLKVCVSQTNGFARMFQNEGYTEMLSGLCDHYDARHQQRLTRENSVYGGETRVALVETKRLDTIARENLLTHIHYLSIDVEGAEFDVIKSIDFEYTHIDVIGFEANYADVGAEIQAFLEARGYKRLDYVGCDILMISCQSDFFQNSLPRHQCAE